MSYTDTGASRNAPRILIVRLSSMGDVIHALPAAAHLKRTIPGMELTWVVRERWSSLLIDNPGVDRVIVLPAGKFRRGPFRFATLREVAAARRLLREHRFEVAVDFQGLLRSAAVTFFSRADKVFGFPSSEIREPLAAAFYSESVLSNAAHVVDKNLDLARAVEQSLRSGWDVHTLEADAGVEFPLPPGKPEPYLPEGDYVLASPFAGWKGKEWPPEYFAELAMILFRETGMPLVIDCAAFQRREAQAIVEQAPAGAALLHPSSVEGLMAATRRARAVVGVDSGPLHIAAALGLPGVAVFGQTDPARNGPYGSTFRVLRDSTAVTSYKHGQRPDPVMRAVSPSDVWEVLSPMLQRKRSAAEGSDGTTPVSGNGFP
ncbi:MAG: lipopolysaccharide heptosyltransferase I [Bryobacterales bacterium]|nr:lipopolysaccharide heptosyltransferase I [Bryobacterales bacterium]